MNKNVWMFGLAHGLLGLLGGAATFAPLMADTGLWWNKRRGIAMAVCASGNYIAGTLWPPLAQWGITHYGWRPTYIVLGLVSGAVVGLIAAFPKELVLAVAGFALLGTIGGGLATAMKDEGSREAALITYLVTASGLTLGGVGAAFWGVVAGALALAVQRWRQA